MTPVEFLTSVWPADGLYCIAVPMTKGYAHHVFKTIEEAAAYVETVKDAKDVFFCVHSLKEEKIWNPNKGEEGGWSVRLQKNMQEARSFFFDLDVGAGDNKYATQAEALADLKRFIAITKLPYPLVTSSGGGLHVYWLLDVSVKSNEWRTYAERLKALAQHHQLKADPARTTDTASVLRVVGTYNHKRGEKRPVVKMKSGAVTELDKFLKLLNDEIIRTGTTVAAPKVVDDSDKYFGESNLTRPDKTFDKPTIMAVFKSCQLMRRLDKERKTHPQNKWYHSLGVVLYCENGQELAHRWSKPHPTYTFEHTEAKIRQQLNVGKPTSCVKLEAECGAEYCAGCPIKGQYPNPVRAARYVDQAPAPVIEVQQGAAVVEVVIPQPPAPYTRMKSGGVSMRATNKDGEEFFMPVYEYDLYPMRRMRNHSAGSEMILWCVNHPKDGIKEFILEADALYDLRAFTKGVAHAGIYVSPKSIKELQNYMVAYIAELQRAAAADAQTTHLGWGENRESFILSDKIFYANGDVKPVTLSNTAEEYAAAIHKGGTLERQKELLEFYNKPGYIRSQFAILLGFAAPIFGSTGQHGVIVNCTGESGASKSSTLYAAAAIWGDPEKYTINGTKDGATAQWRNAKASTLANLPICVDEITTIGLEEAQAMAMGISQSEGRRRLKKDGTPQKRLEGEKSTIVIATSNNSLHGLLSTNNSASTAASMRVFEINFFRQGLHKKWEADDFLHDMLQNFGHLGEVFIQYVVKNYADVHKKVRAEMRALDIEAQIMSGERFWSATAAAAIVAGRIAVQLGLINYDIEAIRKWILTHQIPEMRGVVHEEYSSPSAVLTDYLEIISGNTLVVQKLKSNGIVNILRKPNNQLLAHYDYEDKYMWVLRKGFKDHCSKIGANFLKILDELHTPKPDADGNMKRIVTNRNIKRVLGAGTEFGKSQTWCFVVDLKHPDCLGLPDLTVVENPSATVTPPKGELRAVDGE